MLCSYVTLISRPVGRDCAHGEQLGWAFRVCCERSGGAQSLKPPVPVSTPLMIRGTLATAVSAVGLALMDRGKQGWQQ